MSKIYEKIFLKSKKTYEKNAWQNILILYSYTSIVLSKKVTCPSLTSRKESMF